MNAAPIRRSAPAFAERLVHGVGTIVTMNLADFTRFERHITVIRLEA